MNLGSRGILHEGDGYFRSATYGPQDDPLGHPKTVAVVLQSGGRRGLGIGAERVVTGMRGG